jgi:hypothetical protein
VPILFAVSPFAAIRSAPTRTPGEPRALQQRPRLRHVDVRVGAALREREHDAQRRPVATGGEPARVALGHQVGTVPEQRGAMHAHRAAARDLVVLDPPGARGDPAARLLPVADVAVELGERLLHAPGEVDGRGPRGGQDRALLRQVPTHADRVVGRRPGSERDPHRARHAERGRAADGQHADRVDQLGDGLAAALDPGARQARLVEHHHRLVLEPDDVVRLQHARCP